MARPVKRKFDGYNMMKITTNKANLSLRLAPRKCHPMKRQKNL